MSTGTGIYGNSRGPFAHSTIRMKVPLRSSRAKRARLKGRFADLSDEVFHPFQKGLLYRKSAGLVFVATEDETLAIDTIIDEDDQDFSREMQVGGRFYTPGSVLEKARQFRATYTPTGLKS